MAGTIVVDRIESDASYTSTINVANRITFSNTVNFGVFAGTAPVAGFYLPTTNNLAFTTASTERMRIDSSGNVGIGTASPNYLTTFYKASLPVLQLVNSTSGTTGSDGLLIYLNGVNATISNEEAGFLVLQTSGTERARIDSSGNVGIGTSSPASKLEVSGSGTLELARFATTTDNTPSIGIYSNGSIRAKLRASTAETALLSQGALPLLFGTNDTERARIDSSGNLLVGTTTDNITAVGVRLRGDNIQVAKSGDWSLRVGRTTSTGIVQEIYYNSSRVGDIATNGTGTSYNTASDYRLKESIAPMTGALAKVALLKPCTYKWNVDGSDGQGFIAHELQEVVEGCVTGAKDAVDADGNPQYQGIDTSFLVATLTAALQELHALVKTQDSTITALTTRITALEFN